MTDAAKDYKCSPCGEYKFFLYDPNDGITFWRTAEERDKAAEDAIDSYLDEEWNEEVSGVFAGMSTHNTVEINRVDRVGELDDDGYDEVGEYWANSDWDVKCSYKLQPIPQPDADHVPGATKMALTPEQVEARFRAWWAESYPAAPAGTHAVQSHVAFALHLMGGEVQ